MGVYFAPFVPKSAFKPVGVKYLLIANVVVFIFELIVGYNTAFYYFALDHLRIVRGEFLWTIFTHMFLHYGFWHIFVNMWSLLIFGPKVEEYFGTERFLVIYFGAGLVGALMHVWFSLIAYPNVDIYAVGASGAIFGIMAAYAMLFPHDKLGVFVFVGFIFAPAWLIVLGFVVLQFLFLLAGVPGISFMAHIGGFIGGVVLTKYYLNRMLFRRPKGSPGYAIYYYGYVESDSDYDEDYYYY